MRRLLPLCLLALCLLRSPTASAAEPPTVAVLYFDYTGKNEELAVLRKGLAQMLISDLSGSEAIRVVERDRIEDVLNELKLQGTGKVDAKSAARLGKLLGARYLVLGGYFDLQGAMRVDARIVDVETGRVMKSFGANGKPGDFLPVEQAVATKLDQWFGDNRSASATGSSTPPTASTPPAKKPPRPPAALKTRTAVAYSEALAMLDSGDKGKAKDALSRVIKEQPDFALASLDLDRLMK